MVCGECGRTITWETQKGHYYGRCTKYKSNCSQKKYSREEKVDEQVMQILDSFKIENSRDIGYISGMEKVLVTGGAGFIGSHLAERLLKEKKQVLILDNFDDFYDPREKRENIVGLLKNNKVELIKGDIRNKNLVRRIFNKHNPRVVVHLAARTGVRASIENPVLYQEINYLGTANILEVAKDFNLRNFIFGSSSSVYGERSKVPFKEEDRVERSISPYGASKVAAEEILHVYHHLYDIPITCLRLFTVYGPKQRPDLAIRKFINFIYKGKELTMYGDGTSRRDYTYISDIVEGIVSAVKKPRAFEVVNLGNSSPVLLKDLIKHIEKNVGKKAKIRQIEEQPGDVSQTYADISKAKRLYNWKPEVKIKDGLKQMIEWYVDKYGEKS